MQLVIDWLKSQKSYWFSRKASSHFFVDSKSINKVHKVLQKHPFKQFEQINTIFFSSNICFGYRMHEQQVEFQFKFCKIEKKMFCSTKKIKKECSGEEWQKFFFIFFSKHIFVAMSGHTSLLQAHIQNKISKTKFRIAFYSTSTFAY